MAIDIRKVFEIPADADKRTVSALVKALKENHKKEFDYIKFVHSVQNLIQLGMDEKTAFVSAFTTAQTMGFSKNTFENTSQYYLTILQSQKDSFADALKRQRNDKVSNKLENLKKLISDIEETKNKIKELQSTLKALETKMANFDSTIDQEKQKLEKIKDNFVSSYKYFEQKIKKDIELFNKYL